MIQKALSILLAALCLAGCTLAPTYKQPALPVPSEWPTGPAYKDAGNDGTGINAATTGWRDFYLNGQLREIIELALKNNRDLRITALNIERAKALYRIRVEDLFPYVNASGAAIHERVPGDLSRTGGATTSHIYSVDLGMTAFELDFFGRVRSLKDQALEQYFATEQAWRSAQIALIAEVANVFLTFAADQESLNLTKDTLKSQEESYRLIERRFNVGASSMLDLSQIKTRVEAARRDVAIFTSRLAQDENALALLAGSPIPPHLFPRELDPDMVPQNICASVPSEVLLNRPDIMGAEHQLKAANAFIGAARAALFPTITLTTTIGTASSELSKLFQAGSQAWSFIPQLTMPIFDPRTWSAVKVVKIDKQIAVAQYEKAIQAGFREVADALAQRGTIGDQIAAQQALVDASAEAYRLADARYQRGLDSFLPVLDAQRSLYAAQEGLINLRRVRLTNVVTLYKALGGGANAQHAEAAKQRNGEIR